MVSIKIDRMEREIPVSKLILGHFIEHLGMCVENGVWMYKQTTQSLMDPPLERVRSELFERMKAINPPIVRYPGGCFSDTYHWKDGIGSRETRPKRKNKAWGGYKWFLGFHVIGPKERNHFGTDEFLTLCDRLEAEKYLNVNFGTGTPDEAAAWVEYVNASTETKHGKLREENGHPDPYKVKYWGIANEIYAFWEKGNCKTPQEYAEKYLIFAKTMREVDPDIELVGVGWDRSKWNVPFLQLTKGHVDYLSVHLYLPRIHSGMAYLSFLFGRTALPNNEKIFYTIMNSPYLVKELIEETEKDIITALGEDGLDQCKIAFDEWNIWHHFTQGYRGDTPPYVLRDGLWTACVLNTFIRHAKSMGMANFAMIVNCLGMILTYDDQIVLNPQYLAFKLYSDAWIQDPLLLSVDVDCPTVQNKRYRAVPVMDLPVLDVAAIISKDNKQLTLFCVNKHFTDSIKTEISIDNSLNFIPDAQVKGCVLTHEDPFSKNTRKNPNEINLANFTISVDGKSFTYDFPSHSATALLFSSD